MTKFIKYRDEFIDIFKLMLPVLMAQLAQMALGVVDIIMTGRYSSADMAAVGLGFAIWMPASLFGVGLIIAVVPTVGQLCGAKKAGTDEMYDVIRQGIWLALLISIPIIFLMIVMSFNLELIGMDASLASIASKYLRFLMIGAIPCFLYVVLHNLLEGFSLVRPALVASIIGLCVNIPVNYAFIYGKFGLPEMGGAGAGIALSITYIAMLIVIIVFAMRHSDISKSIKTFGLPKLAILKRLVRIGFPSALATLNEGGLFAAITLLTAPFGTIIVAGHNVAMNISTVIFLIPFSIGVSSTIRISNAIGSHDADQVRLTTRTALMMGISFASFTAILTIILRYKIAGLYNNEADVIAVAGSLLLIDACYQLSDAFQCVSVGVLRGYNDTKAIFVVSCICFWLITLPISYMLGRVPIFGKSMGVSGLWWGLVIGITLVAVCYAMRLRYKERCLKRNQWQDFSY